MSLKLGIVGACGRGASFKAACDAIPEARIEAVCDTYAEGLPDAARRLGARVSFADFDSMLAAADLDAVLIGTPMHFHVPQAVAALRRGLHVLSEVPAGVSIDECRQLVAATRDARGVYMMAENYTYLRSNVIVREIARRGLFGTPYYGLGAYVHELKELNEQTRWRRVWQTGINGNTYPTHSLGPLLQWMPGQRVTAVSCSGSGHHYRDPRGDAYQNEDSTTTVCRLKEGAQIVLRLDMLSERPHAMTNYELQGDEGCYESGRAHGERDRIWIKSRCPDRNRWRDLEEFADEFLPEQWKAGAEAASQAGHGGGDYFEVVDFIHACLRRRPNPIDVHAAMDMTLPGLCSQQSIAQGGRWVDVPDSRAWLDAAAPRQQLQMRVARRALESPPELSLPDGYRLRQLRPGEEQAYIRLMDSAGFGGWTVEQTQGFLRRVLPGGFFVVEHLASGALVATAMANHGANEQHPNGGVLDWVAADPAHKGKGLGRIVVAAVMRLLTARGYTDIWLLTDDWRLPAIAVYLQLGWEPLHHAPDMAERWNAVMEQLRR